MLPPLIENPLEEMLETLLSSHVPLDELGVVASVPP